MSLNLLPSAIAPIIVILLLMIVGIFGFFSIVGEGEITSVFEREYTVTNASTNQSLYVIGGLENIIVEQILSDGTVIYVDPAYWDYTMLYITVNHSILIWEVKKWKRKEEE